MKKILVVDDSSFMRDVLKDLLISNIPDIEIIEAESKAEALEKIKKQEPDLVLLDIVMKENEYEGIEALEEIKKTNPNLKIIMLSSVGQSAIMEKCKQFGVSDYIQKPFDREEVLNSVKKYLS